MFVFNLCVVALTQSYKSYTVFWCYLDFCILTGLSCRLWLLSDKTRGIIDFICLPFAHNGLPMREICIFLARFSVPIEKYIAAKIFNYYIDFSNCNFCARTVAKEIVNVIHASLRKILMLKE